MADRFVPCGSCARHVKASESACPFCGTTLPETAAPTGVLANPLSRAAVLFVGMTSVATACGGNEAPTTSGTTTSSSSSSGSPQPTAVPAYAPAPAPTDTTVPHPVPMYGPAVVPDGGKDAH